MNSLIQFDLRTCLLGGFMKVSKSAVFIILKTIFKSHESLDTKRVDGNIFQPNFQKKTSRISLADFLLLKLNRFLFSSFTKVPN